MNATIAAAPTDVFRIIDEAAAVNCGLFGLSVSETFTREDIETWGRLGARGRLQVQAGAVHLPTLIAAGIVVPVTEGVPEWELVPESHEETVDQAVAKGKTEAEKAKILCEFLDPMNWHRLAPKWKMSPSSLAFPNIVLLRLSTPAHVTALLQSTSYGAVHEQIWDFLGTYSGEVEEAAEPLLLAKMESPIDDIKLIACKLYCRLPLTKARAAKIAEMQVGSSVIFSRVATHMLWQKLADLSQ